MEQVSGADAALEGPAFYDVPAVFEIYRRARSRATSPNELIEEPVVLELLGSVRGLRVLDLGCGDASFGRRLLSDGCAAYVGVDASSRMVRLARSALQGTNGVVHHQRLEDVVYPAVTFDRVVSRLALHYVRDLAGVLASVHHVLAPNGRLIFSVEHPVITSCDAGWDQSGPRSSWLVDNYFATGRRDTAWLGGRVVKYHRTIEDYVGLVQQSGFRLDALREGRPREERFTTRAEFERRCRIPLFLIVGATRSSDR